MPRLLLILSLFFTLTYAGCCFPSGDSASTSSSSRATPRPKPPAERERLIRASLDSEMWKAVRKMIRAKNPKPSDIYVKLNPPDAETAETAAAADVLFDLRNQELDVHGYQLHWDTDSSSDEAYARDASFGDWKMRNGLALLPDEIDDALPAEAKKDTDSTPSKR